MVRFEQIIYGVRFVFAILAVLLAVFILPVMATPLAMFPALLILILASMGYTTQPGWPRRLSLGAFTLGALILVSSYLGQMGMNPFMQDSAHSPAVKAEWLGKPSPNLVLQDLKGQPYDLSEMRGKRVLIVFWSMKCPPCLEEIPSLMQLADLRNDNPFEILAITTDAPDALKPFVAEQELNYPVISHSVRRLPAPYSLVHAIPMLFVVSPEGIFEDIHLGYLSNTELKEIALAPSVPLVLPTQQVLENKTTIP